MQKRGLVLSFISAILGVVLMNFVSAQYYGGSSFSGLLSSIDSSTMILGVAFIVSFALMNYALSRVFRDNKAIAGIVSFSLSLLLIWVINKTGLDFEGFFYGTFGFIGISEEILFTVIPFILLAAAIFLVIKFGFGAMLAIIGGFLLIVSLTDLVYEKGVVLVIGTVLLLLGLWLWRRKKKRSLGNYPSNYGRSSSGKFGRGMSKFGRGAKAVGGGAWRGAKNTGKVLGTGKFKGVENWAANKRQEGQTRRQQRRVMKEQRSNEKLRRQQVKGNQRQKKLRLKQQRGPGIFKRSARATGRTLGTGKFQGVENLATKKREKWDTRKSQRLEKKEMKTQEKLRKRQLKEAKIQEKLMKKQEKERKAEERTKKFEETGYKAGKAVGKGIKGGKWLGKTTHKAMYKMGEMEFKAIEKGASFLKNKKTKQKEQTLNDIKKAPDEAQRKAEAQEQRGQEEKENKIGNEINRREDIVVDFRGKIESAKSREEYVNYYNKAAKQARENMKYYKKMLKDRSLSSGLINYLENALKGAASWKKRRD